MSVEQNSAPLIAIDLGSNSFHLLCAQYDSSKQSPFIETERNKQIVQLARGINEQGNLCQEAKTRALACLTDFNHIIARHPNARIKAVATEAMRQADGQDNFLQQAETALGQPIELITTEQEATYTFHGINVCCPRQQHTQKKLVIDIGGASTEFIIGRDTAQQSVSLAIGCVTLGDRHFKIASPITPEAFQCCYDEVHTQLQSLTSAFHSDCWDIALGAAGTMGVVAKMLGEKARIGGEYVISRSSLQTLIDQMLEQGCLAADLPDNLKHDVMPAGLAMILAIYDVLNITQLHVSPASIKEGLMVSLLAADSTSDA